MKSVCEMEQVIVFVYDTGYCQTEADDPQKAVLFFHPHWVSDQQRLALCGQLMGATHFCSTMFSTPRVLTLQCGKFVLKKYGRYILNVGSDQTLPEWILQERFKNLELLFQFYHNSFDSIFNRVDCDQEKFSKKLTAILGTFIPILQCVVYAFGNVFILRCPKKNSSAFLEALQLLESCCNFKGVLGGVVLHNSRVVATQLDSDITKLLALTNKFHLKSYAEEVKLACKLPDGVHLVKVYLKKELHNSLHHTANFKLSVYNGVQKKFLQKTSKIMRKKKEPNKIFTVKEDEDWNEESLPKLNEAIAGIKDTIRLKTRKSKSKLETNTLKERSKSFLGGGNVKVCSTPTIEKTLIHEELVSICGTGKVEPKKKTSNLSSTLVPDVVQDAINLKFRSRIISTKYSHNRFFRISMDDLMIDFSQRSYPVPLKYYSFGLPKTYREVGMSIKREKGRKNLRRRGFYKTIADPMNPVFRYDGIPVSKTLYNTYLEEHYKDFVVANRTIDSREELLKSRNSECENFHVKPNANLTIIENNVENVVSEPKVNGEETLVGTPIPMVVPQTKNELTKANQKAFRRSLSLPLKPLVFDAPDMTTQGSSVKNKILFSRTPTTPLTTKLSLLAFEEQQLEIKTLSTPSDNHLRTVMSNQACSTDDKKSETIPATLFLFGHQNMAIMLLLDDGLEKNSDVIQSLWEASSSTLRKVEHMKNKNLSSLPNNGGGNNNNSAYSFLSLDSHWGAVQRSGSWPDDELKVVGSLHHDLNESSNITEIIIRNEDSVVYGYSCGGAQIFYQQGGCSGAGLPTPADLMGMVTLKARRRLERDRGVILL